MSAFVQEPALLKPGTEKRGLDARHILDVCLVLMALLWLAPLMAIIAAAIWLESGGPIFFSQIRLGEGGRAFRLHKFRKFHAQGRHRDLAVTLKNDPRMTRVGRALERTKLDELPQLWNVLVGEMAIVGPRPESLAFADCFSGPFSRVLDYKPGILGPCQVMFRNESDFYATGCNPEEFYRTVLFPLKADIDLQYFSHRSLVSDARWAVCSILSVFGWSLLPVENTQCLQKLESQVQKLSQRTACSHLPDVTTLAGSDGRRFQSSLSNTMRHAAPGDGRKGVDFGV